MSEKTTVAQVVQIGVEVNASGVSVPGTAVTATKRFASLSIEPKMEADIKSFRPAGRKFTTMTQLNKEWSTAKLEGIPTYEEIIYVLSSCFDKATITTPSGGTLSRLWSFAMDPDSPDAPVTFTVEKGDSAGGVRFAYSMISGMALSVSRSEVGLSGDMLMGIAETHALSNASGVTALTQTPLAATGFNIYLDTLYSNIGTTKLTRGFKLDVEIGDRFKGVWPIDSAYGSFAAHVEGEPKASVSLTVSADSVADAFLAQLRDGSTKYMRLECTGPVIEAALRYKFTLDMALKVSAVQDFSDEDGIYAQGFELALVDDASLRVLACSVQNKATAL